MAVACCLVEGKVSRETKTIEECKIDIKTKDWLRICFQESLPRLAKPVR